jgi:uncharacterized protein (TIGR02284 family)
MATMVGKQTDLVSFLKQLIELEYDGLEAYDSAINRLSDATYKAQFQGFRNDHQRHVSELDAAMRAIGSEPPRSGDLKRVLTKGKIVIIALAGDRAILTAMKSNEDDMNTAYERAVTRNDIGGDLKVVLERSLADERRHRSWIEQQLTAPRPERAAPPAR